MQTESPISTRMLMFCLVASVILLSYIFIKNFFNHQTVVVFCSLSKGLTAYMRVENKTDILINTGSDKKILDCLSKEMPFFDRTIEYLIFDSASDTNIGGLPYILKRYRVNTIYTIQGLPKTKLIKEISSTGNNFPVLKELSTVSLQLDRMIVSADQVKRKTLVKNILTFDYNNYVLYFMEQLNDREIYNYSRQNYCNHIIKKCLYVYSVMGLYNNLIFKKLALADNYYIVIIPSSSTSYTNKINEIQARLNSIKIEYVVLDQGKDVRLTLN